MAPSTWRPPWLDDDAAGSMGSGDDCVRGIENPFDEDRKSGAVHQARNVFPRQVRDQHGPEELSPEFRGVVDVDAGTEHGIGSQVCQAHSSQEREVALGEVSGTKTRQGGVECDDESGVSGGLGSADQARVDVVVCAGVELEPPGCISHDTGDVFKGGG